MKIRWGCLISTTARGLTVMSWIDDFNKLPSEEHTRPVEMCLPLWHHMALVRDKGHFKCIVELSIAGSQRAAVEGK